MTAEIFAALGAVLCTAVVGVIGYIAHLAKKSGQKQAEAEIEQQHAKDAKAAGAVVVEHREPSAVVDRLSNGSF